MSECKTIADLHREYARVLDMCEGANIKPHDCIKYTGYPFTSSELFTGTIKEISFNGDPVGYQFALCLVEGKPVFEGDKLWTKSILRDQFIKLKVQSYASDIVYLFSDDGLNVAAKINDLSWQKPQQDPYAPFKEAIKSADKWVQINVGGWADVMPGTLLYNLLHDHSPDKTSICAFSPECLRIVDKIITWESSTPDAPTVKNSYNRETCQITAEIVK